MCARTQPCHPKYNKNNRSSRRTSFNRRINAKGGGREGGGGHGSITRVEACEFGGRGGGGGDGDSEGIEQFGGDWGGSCAIAKGQGRITCEYFRKWCGICAAVHRMANTDSKGYLRRSFSAKEPCGQWPLCGKRPAREGILWVFATIYQESEVEYACL